jgi:hypothetical protein
MYSMKARDIVRRSDKYFNCKGFLQSDEKSVDHGSLWSLREYHVDLIACRLTARGLQITQCALHIRVPEPLLHRAKVYTGPERPCGEGCAELVKVDGLFI